MSPVRSTLVLEVLTSCALLGQRFTIHPDQKLLLGRTALSDIALDHLTVSRRHAWVWFEEGQWKIQDAGSHPGTSVDERRCPDTPCPLPYGSVLRLGGLDLRASEGAPDRTPTVPVGEHPRIAGEASVKAQEAARAACPPQEPPLFAGRFDLQQALGRGNQGTVHRAYDAVGRSLVALKIYDALSEDDQIRRFLTAQTSSVLRYDAHFVKHLAVGVADRTPYVALELLTGERLTDRLQVRPLRMRQAVSMMASLAYSVGKLHAEGLLHRNIKPDNILFSKYAPESPHLSDIWVDMRMGMRPMYRRELLRASRGYLAPEHARTGEADARSDVYSLAAILYRCVAGCMPVPSDDPNAPEYGRPGPSSGEPPQPLIEVRPDAPKALCDLLGAALSPSPEARPTALDLAFALGDIEKAIGLAGEAFPFPVSRVATGRRAAPRPQVAIDPFTDTVFQDELYGLVLPRCKAESARGYLHSLTHAVYPSEGAHPSGCALCGIPFVGQDIVAIKPDGFVLVSAEDAPRARDPYLCRACTWGDFAAADAALQQTLAFLSGRGDEPLRPGGPTRRKLREGLSQLIAAHLPHVDDHAPCTRCARREGTLKGATLDLCPSCVAAAREAAEHRYKALQRGSQERLRAAFARLFVAGEARLRAAGRRTRRTDEKDVALPQNRPGEGWFYLDVEHLERDPAPSHTKIDEVANKLATSLEAHVLSALRAADQAGGAPQETQAESGLPGYVARFVARFRPSPPVAERLDMAIAVGSELLRAGHRFTHQVEDYEWRDATDYFTTLHDLTDRPR